jgi:fructokinase
MKILSVGEVLWDVFDNEELLGGAPLNFSASTLRLGDQPDLISMLGVDIRGDRALEKIKAMGLICDFIQRTNRLPTGVARVTLDEHRNSTFQLERPAAYDAIELGPLVLEDISAKNFDWMYYGTLLHTTPEAEVRLHQLLKTSSPARGFYDVNLREGHWNLGLVKRLSQTASVIKVNADEAHTIFHLEYGDVPYTLEKFCQNWSTAFELQAVCVTLGNDGCAIWHENQLQYFPGYPVTVVDTVGAGDSFAAVFLHGFHYGWPMEKTAQLANAVGALVASRPGALPAWSLEECEALISTAAL